ncbi:MAG: HAMP domain-containing sensor histidine kinase [Bacteroidota bacterium]|nr:HAMP domain-containing sensor histidine kinase [Bacteroidota bacterium]
MNTYPAPAERAPQKIILEQANIVKNDPVICDFVNYLPETLVVLNEQRQIVYSNSTALQQEDILGKRPGEFLNCAHKNDSAGGCGTSEFCSTCGALNAILNSLNGLKDIQECRILTGTGDSLDFRVMSSPVQIAGNKYAIVAISNIADEKRRLALERIFFHDVLNTASGIKSIAHLISGSDPEEVKELVGYLGKLSDQLIDEIQSQRQLTLAENNELKLDVTSVFIDDIFSFVVEQYSNSDIAHNITLQIDAASQFALLKTDMTILRRIIGNLVKNAIEASKKGDVITIGCISSGNSAIKLKVHNPGVMPKEVQLQVFSRSFSTKGTNRGLGTYSIKLLTEKYLKGKVYFESTERNGTTFFVELPKEIEEKPLT